MNLDYNEIMGRFKTKLGFKNDNEIAALFKMSTAALSERKKRGAIPFEQIIEVCRKRGISMDYLITGRAEEFNGQIIYECDRSDIDEEKMIVVPYFQDIRCAAGIGCINDESSTDEISYIVLPRDGYPELSRSQHRFHAVTAHGDSMEGNIMDGAILLVDLGDKGSESGKIYVVNTGGEVLVKRVFTDPSDPSFLLLRSDNIYYPQFRVDRESIEVIGRVVFVYNRAKLV